MKTQYYTSSTLDGFIATEEDSLEWLFSLADLNNSSYPGFIAEVGAIAMGSTTYEWIVRNSAIVAAETGSMAVRPACLGIHPSRTFANQGSGHQVRER